MKKTNILRLIDEEKFICLIVKKKRDFFKFVNSIFHDVEDKLNIPTSYPSTEAGKEGKRRKVRKLIDVHERYKSEKITLDIFYSRKTAFLMIHSPSSIRKKIINNIEKFGEITGK